MNVDRRQPGRYFLARWVVASSIGLMAGFILYFISVVGLTKEQGFILKTLVSAGSGAILGAAVGGAQLIVLRNEVPGINRWMAANLFGGTIGGVVALPVANAVGDAAGFNLAVFAGSIVLGVFLGIAQAVILKEHLAGGGWWVLAHTAGISLGWAIGRGLGESVYSLGGGGAGKYLSQVIATLLTIILFFGGYGVITGGILVRLFRNPINPRN